MPRFAEAKVKDGAVTLGQQFGDGLTSGKMLTMRAPGCNHVSRPKRAFLNGLVIGRSNGIGRGAHCFGVCVTPCKDVGDSKATISQRPRAPFATLHSRVVLYFGRG